MAKETLNQQDKRNLDLQLDRELEGTFPASDPLTITRFPYRRGSVESSGGSNADGATVRPSHDESERAGTNSQVTQKS